MQLATCTALLVLCAVGCPRCERPTEVALEVHTDSPVDLAIDCPHLKVYDKLGKTPFGPFHAHIGDTLLFTDEDAGFYYAEAIATGDPKDPPRLIERDFHLPR